MCGKAFIALPGGDLESVNQTLLTPYLNITTSVTIEIYA